MFNIFKKTPELDCKSKTISIMYLTKAKRRLEDELAAGKEKGESDDDLFTTIHDIKCLERAIEFLNK